ncbi:MAG: sigma-70 family RNA polymerase sigma factor [Deltaproteobacteria bacterium]|nr:sigma-70 family RNA polymerase sigma factor [Deltaproteobacteria bacterium]
MKHAHSLENPTDSKQSWPDEKLIKGYLKGEMDCFRVIYDRYQQRVFFITRRYFNDGNKAEEVFQEIFLKVIQKLSGYQNTGSFRAWLFKLCRNHCIDVIRSQARKKEVNESNLHSNHDSEDNAGVLDELATVEATMENHTYDQQLAKKLDLALTSLPEEQKEVFLLKERGGLTFEEIAEMIQVSVNTAKSRMRYALKSLRRSLKSKSYVKETLQ